MTTALKAQLDEIVWIDSNRMSGEPCFKGTRVPIQALIDHIEGNSTLEDLPNNRIESYQPIFPALLAASINVRAGEVIYASY